MSPVDGRGDIGFVGGISAVTPAPATSAIPDMVSDGVVLPQAALRPGGPGYRIQLGVFGDAGNALKLYEQLAAQGYEGHIQSRVLVGPFADRAAAEKARQALRQAGVGQGVLLPPEHSK
ncbi:SPOR domain-containing protein [Thauera sp.]|uniref:SPOR domain-containing protein n=1 Tax=Thauera sp. TaxID=1905334 RepID=UPI002A3703E3|nr:SPOR domain-containing protein [Thauera sp.]MDX9884227.1 SPOR domain-containing protein [Thauera sp.]